MVKEDCKLTSFFPETLRPFLSPKPVHNAVETKPHSKATPKVKMRNVFPSVLLSLSLCVCVRARVCEYSFLFLLDRKAPGLSCKVPKQKCSLSASRVGAMALRFCGCHRARVRVCLSSFFSLNSGISA